MLADVKTETLVNTPSDAASVRCSVSCELNRVERLGASREKTCFNWSRGSRDNRATLSSFSVMHYRLGFGGKVLF